jgi:hypothetical protein
MPPTGKNAGTNTSSMQYSPAARKKMKRKRDSLQKRFNKLAGPVTIRKVGASE